jgi:hypothetical protein
MKTLETLAALLLALAAAVAAEEAKDKLTIPPRPSRSR